MAVSMTGFGRAQCDDAQGGVLVELRGVNHRYLDVRLQLPPGLEAHRTELENRIRTRLERGRVEGRIETWSDRADVIGGIDEVAAEAAFLKLRALADRALGGLVVQLSDVLRVPGVLRTGPGKSIGPTKAIDPPLEVIAAAVDQALTGLQAMRGQEGESLTNVLVSLVSGLRHRLEEIETRLDAAQRAKADRLRNRAAEWSQELEIDPGRVAQEVAWLLERIDVTEELDRLRSHLRHFDQLLRSAGPIGRELDFLAQEAFREINTLATKAGDADLSRSAVAFKSELEKVREQVQNLE